MERISKAVVEILLAIGEDPNREGLKRTPARVAEMYSEIFCGIHREPAEVLQVGFEENHQEMVILKDIPFYSMCEHHLLPFHGTAHIGYIPSGRVVGISKIARVVEVLARRPQLQERLTSQVADAIMANVKPIGVGVVIEAEHLCMTMRGIRKPGSRVVTSANRGIFLSRRETRSEFLSLIGQNGSS
ncbi:MAG: GTP cyclohydrolase I FolE [Anaerolineae bacterium]